MKKYFTILLIILSVTIFFFLYTKKISEKEAFEMIFHNYDSDRKGAIWRQNDTPKYESFFSDDRDENEHGFVSTVLLKSYREGLKQKTLFITKTVPDGFPYDCHACYPLISATIFVKYKNKWKIESQNLFLTYEGEYGFTPEIQLIKIGKHRVGATLKCEHRNMHDLTHFNLIIVPYENKIEIAHKEIIYYDNFNGCGWGAQCSTYSASIAFDRSKNDEFYPLNIKRFGTQDDEYQGRAIPVDEESIYHFKNGKYEQVFWDGYLQLDYKAIDSCEINCA